MRNVSSIPAGEWETSGKTVQTKGHEYLGVAKNKDLATLWAEANELLKVCLRAANGERVTVEEFLKVTQKFR